MASPRTDGPIQKVTPMSDGTVDRDHILVAERAIRPHIRRTPVIDVAGDDFGLGSVRICVKLEQLQHSGSFKVRGAFVNLLMRICRPPVWWRPRAATTVRPSHTPRCSSRCRPRFSCPASRPPQKFSGSATMAPILWSEARVTRTRLPRVRPGPHNRPRCRFTRSTRPRRCWDRARSASNWKNKPPTSTRCLSRLAVAD